MDSSAALAYANYANIPVFSALIFWTFIAIVAVAGMVKEFANKREVQRTLRAAIEKGQPLDPAVVETILSTSAGQPERLAAAGIIVAAAGIGMIPLGLFIGMLAGDARYPIIGSGCLFFSVGVGLYAAASFLRRLAPGARKPM